MKKLFLFLILGASTLLMGQDSLEVLEVEIQDSYKEIKLIPGKVLPTQISNLAFEIPGIVYKINADIGDRFAKGDVLAELDSREVNANFMQAEARFKLSKLALDRFEDLKKDGFISAQEFDRASAEYDVAKSELEFFKVKLSQTKITAPYDGFIQDRMIDQGAADGSGSAPVCKACVEIVCKATPWAVRSFKVKKESRVWNVPMAKDTEPVHRRRCTVPLCHSNAPVLSSEGTGKTSTKRGRGLENTRDGGASQPSLERDAPHKFLCVAPRESREGNARESPSSRRSTRTRP